MRHSVSTGHSGYGMKVLIGSPISLESFRVRSIPASGPFADPDFALPGSSGGPLVECGAFWAVGAGLCRDRVPFVARDQVHEWAIGALQLPIGGSLLLGFDPPRLVEDKEEQRTAPRTVEPDCGRRVSLLTLDRSEGDGAQGFGAEVEVGSLADQVGPGASDLEVGEIREQLRHPNSIAQHDANWT